MSSSLPPDARRPEPCPCQPSARYMCVSCCCCFKQDNTQWRSSMRGAVRCRALLSRPSWANFSETQRQCSTRTEALIVFPRAHWQRYLQSPHNKFAKQLATLFIFLFDQRQLSPPKDSKNTKIANVDFESVKARMFS